MALGKGLQSLIPPKKDGGGENDTALPNVPRAANAVPILSEDANMPHRETGAAFLSAASAPSPTERHVGQENRPHMSQNQRQEAVFQIEVEKIKPNPYQPRREFHEAALDELAASIREFGVIQPLIVSKVVRETETGTKVEYQLVAGERRLKASKRAGLERVPAIVRKIDEGKMKLEVALIENLQRSDLTPLEAARAYARLQDEFQLTQREVAQRVGKSREVVANTLRLLNLPSPMQEALGKGRITESHARVLLSIADPKEQERMFRGLIEGKMSVQRLREKKEEGRVARPEENYWEKRLEERLGAPVQILKKGSRGKIVLQFYSDEEMRSLLERLSDER